MGFNFCARCGSEYADNQVWPRSCSNCHMTIFYPNPHPVAVAVIPVVGGGLVAVRRSNDHIGELALPGGYIFTNETWQQGLVREVLEEANAIVLSPASIIHVRTVSTPSLEQVLIFGLTEDVSMDCVNACTKTYETDEVVVIYDHTDLVFSLHAEVAQEYFRESAHLYKTKR